MKTLALLALSALVLGPAGRCQPTPSETPTAQKLFDQGLFEEETNRDIEKAASDYTAAVAAFDADRKFAAMALFRLAEAREKQGRKEEAEKLRDRLSREFPDQVPGQAKAKQEAQEQMVAWLALIDAGDYAGSWDKAADYFQRALTQKAWVQACNAVRKPLGATKSRVFKSATFRDSFPGAPAGKYIILQFTTSFENLDNAVETVTPMQEKDGKWRSTGYLIRPGDASYSPP